MKTSLVWNLGYCDTESSMPKETFAAKVPGSVQLDYAAAYGLPDYRFETNFEQYRWMEDKYWVYSAEYDARNTDLPYLRFIAKGIDYKYDIYVNETKKFSHEGMYRTVILDLNEYIGKIVTLKIVVHPVPKSNVGLPSPNTRDEQNQCCKPAVSYGWDFHPRLIPLGIWEEAYIETSSLPEHIKPNISYTLNTKRDVAALSLRVNVDENVKWRFVDPDGKVIFEGVSPSENFEIASPLLWWCNGYGAPNLYTWELTVPCGDTEETFSGKIGFKTVSLEMNANTWSLPDFPKSRSCPPITLCLNGIPIFAKGSNWVCPEIFYSELTPQRYREQLQLVKDANMNILRCWGGAIVNKESFFDLCDEMGILVWQEFPLACNNYHATEHYMELLKCEANDIIDRVAGHACHAIWCGGNELFNSWSGMTDQSLALRLLNSITFERTPNIPFLATSPLMGMGHGSYLFVYHNGKEVVEVMQHSNNTAYTEFGVPAFSNLDCLQQITDLKNLFPMVANDVTCAHHGFDAWGKGQTWCSKDTIQSYFGESNSLEQLVNRGQFLQKVGYRFIFEEARRQKPHCSMAINWCFNEPWPCIANNSVICYPNSIKPSYYEIAKACRPVAATARYRKLRYRAEEMLEFDLFLLNDGVSPLDPMEIVVLVQVGNEDPVRIMTWEVPYIEANTNFSGPTLRYCLPVISNAETCKIILAAGDASSEYTLLYNCPQHIAPKKKTLNM
ncbi:MAG: hypothetical protein IKD06_00620 [Clostridia bacterium]|nr:hypothetical protein [Clostridia bacterium]